MTNTPTPSTPIVNVLVYALVAVLTVCAVLVGTAAVFHFVTTELVVSVLGLAGVVVAALVGLLNAQIANLHLTVNSRMDELVKRTDEAAFSRGQLSGDRPGGGPAGPQGPIGPQGQMGPQGGP